MDAWTTDDNRDDHDDDKDDDDDDEEEDDDDDNDLPLYPRLEPASMGALTSADRTRRIGF